MDMQVRPGTRRRWLLWGGLAWPFVVALVGVALTAAGIDFSDAQACTLLAASFMGAPAVVYCICRRWPGEARLSVALLLAVPMVLVEICVAMVAFGAGYILVGGHVPA